MNADFLEQEKIQDMMRRYIDAVSAADVDKLKTFFHPKATMYGYIGPDRIIFDSPELLYSDLRRLPSMFSKGTDFRYVIQSLLVTGDVASVCIAVDNFFGVAYVVDHMQLIKINKEWKIVSKTASVLEWRK